MFTFTRQYYNPVITYCCANITEHHASYHYHFVISTSLITGNESVLGESEKKLCKNGTYYSVAKGHCQGKRSTEKEPRMTTFYYSVRGLRYKYTQIFYSDTPQTTRLPVFRVGFPTSVFHPDPTFTQNVLV